MHYIKAGESIQEALDRLPDDGSRAVVVLAPGVYTGQVVISRPNTELKGDDPEHTVLDCALAAREILPDGEKRGTFRTATCRIAADHVTLRGLTVRNSSGPSQNAGQAIALYVDGDAFLCEDCSLVSFQDTLFTAPLPPKEIEKNGFVGPGQFTPRTPQKHVYRHCRISGDVDFIFGGAAAWFEACDIVSTDGRADKGHPYVGYCTAASTPEGQPFGYVFHDCRFINGGVPTASVYLGRPWREYARTVFMNCSLGNHIHPAAFHDWDKPAFHEHGYYAISNCTFEGKTGPWMQDVHALTDQEAAEYTMEAFLAAPLKAAPETPA